jgi:two-component system nitrogen regulation sensor histidine kinase NtrY
MNKAGEILHNVAKDILKDFIRGQDNDRILQYPAEIDGETKIFVAHITKIVDAYGKLENILLMLDDNTNLINLQRITLWKEVATRIAHELKNPLTPIKLMAERVKRKSREIQDPALEKVVDSGMQMIVTEVDELIQLVEEFNMYARTASYIRSDVRLLPIIQEVINMQVEHCAEISVNVPPELSLYGDRHQLKRVMLNLIQNALQVLDKEDKNISITAKVVEDRVHIAVEDNGSGISEEDLPKVFIPYFSKKPAGTGLGLAIVKKIIEEHNGAITVESKAGEFTRFDINLPQYVSET